MHLGHISSQGFVDPLMHQTAASEYCNVADRLAARASEAPTRPAVIWTHRVSGGRAEYRQITFAELEALACRCADGLRRAGVLQGMKSLVMVQPGANFIAVMFGLFKLGAVPVLVDPGMGVKRMLECVRSCNVEAFIGVPKAHVFRVLNRKALPAVRVCITVGHRWFWGGHTLARLTKSASSRIIAAQTCANDLAAILFTSGSTGSAKGVAYEHGMFDAQIRAIQSQYNLLPGEVDLPCFAPFGLFSVAMGMTAVIPDMDPSRPAQVDPVHIVRAIQDHGVTNTFGSPAIWERVSAHCNQRGIKLPSLRRVLMAGAPVHRRLVENVERVLADGADVFTPYGATEAMPVSSISGREILNGCGERARSGGGTCVGDSLDGVDVTVMRLSNDPIPEWNDDLLVPDNEIGELAVSGPVVTREYWGKPDANALSKTHEGDTVWHRMGDVGYRDSDGRIWFCGRKADCVRTKSGLLFTDPCENIFREHPAVRRCALVGVGAPGSATPVMVVELDPTRVNGGSAEANIRKELLELARAHSATTSISQFLFHRSLPVDVRHNIKINREALTAWAEKQLS